MFKHLIVITPLGLLYGSSGSFLSPENLVGRSGNRFPPSSATVSGLFASLPDLDINNLRIAGPFWARSENPQNFFVPTPFTILAKKPFAQISGTEQKGGEVAYRLSWNAQKEGWLDPKAQSITGKFDTDSWLPIEQWTKPSKVYQSPWQYLPHLHPRLEDSQRKVSQNEDQGSLFLENAVQLDPDACLVYLSNQSIPDGWYRFGGEGHMVDVQTIPISNSLKDLLNQPVGKQFALITPAIWGSNRLSRRLPEDWEEEALLTDRPVTFRYRLGGSGATKRLSRGRYAVPAGTVYHLKQGIDKPWYDWDESWFPQEGYSFNRWGSGLALPL
jgi:CRISPR-associated protein Cmr3